MSSMLAIHTLGSIEPCYGGPSVSVPNLCRTIAEGENAGAALVVPAEPSDQATSETVDGYLLQTLRYRGSNRLRITPGLTRTAERLMVAGNTVVHCHGLWMYPQWAVGRLAIRRRVPLVISPRGMLQGWALARRRGVKRLLAHTVLKQHLERASLYHALSRQELTEIREFGVQCPAAVVPNGIDIQPPVPAEAVEALRTRFPSLRRHRICLFLSRLHPKKNLEGLLDAWARLSSDSSLSDWHLVIAGDGADAYVEVLRQQVGHLGLGECVSFFGGVYGPEKDALLSSAALFVLPSFSEGFSMAVLEAAASGLPVVMTEGCNFPELVQAGGAVIAQTSAEALADSLHNIMGRPEAVLQEMGAAGATLVRAQYSWQEVGRSMVEVYRWLLDGGPQPASVVT